MNARTPARIPELLAPAGDQRALRAALGAGADAVYFGLERWSARAFAGNFAGEQGVEAVELAHLYGARAHLALNTLLKDDEVEPALATLEAPYRAGLDALIVADLAFAAKVRERYPGLELHASTQLNTHSSAQLGVLARLGFARAILARELSLAEIAALDSHGLDLEAFVHGALCYGYSGDCLLSSMVGGRSGNRGRCSQSCRMRYDLTVPYAAAEGRGGVREGAGEAAARQTGTPSARTLSTADLCAIGALPQLRAAGVTSFKVEGRMKDAAYVAVTTAVYREALDAALVEGEGYRVRPAWLDRLEQSFSRGFTTAYLDARPHEVRSGGRGGHRGVLVGRVERLGDRGEAVVRLVKAVDEGDVLSVYTPWGQTEPARVTEAAAGRLTLRLAERVALKDRVFRVASATADAFAHELVSGRTVARPVELAARLEGRAGEPARLTVRDADGSSATVSSEQPLAPARTVALDDARAREALGALGGTPYRLEELDLALDGALFLPVGALKELRRQALAGIDGQRIASRRRTPPSPGTAPSPLPETRPSSRHPATPPRDLRPAAPQWDEPPVVLLVRPDEEPVHAPGIEAVCLDLLASDPPEGVAAAAARLHAAGRPLRCRPPEVLFDADAAWLSAVLGLGWSAVHVRHLGLLDAVPATVEVILEYPVQGLSAGATAVATGLLGRRPAAAVASPEVLLDEIAALTVALGGPPAVEVLAFGRQQVLRSRDQVGRAEGLFAAPGPGEHVALLLEDAKGYGFPAEVDSGGTRLFNARVTNMAPNLDELRAAGVSAFLVVQRDMNDEERRAFASGGLAALARFASPDRSTSGHLFRGVT